MNKPKPSYQELKDKHKIDLQLLNETQQLSKIGSWNWNVVTNEVSWSDMMFTILGLKPKEQKPSYELALRHVHDEDKTRYEQVLDKAVTDKSVYFLENKITKKDNSVVNVISRGRCILDANGNLIRMIGTVQDLSDQKKLEKLNEEIIRAEESGKLKAVFLSIIAHDLKSPFNSILSFFDLLSSDVKDGNYDNILGYIAIIKNITKHSNNLLNNLLDWSLSQSDRIDFNPEKINLKNIIDDQIDFYESISYQKKITIISDITSEMEIIMDKNMLLTIIRNLISNAIKYSHYGDDIAISATLSENELTVNVVDYGIGIKPDKLDELFRIDHKFSARGTNDEKGTGLGLKICQEFIKKHNGELIVKSEIGKGSKFSFIIPQN